MSFKKFYFFFLLLLNILNLNNQLNADIQKRIVVQKIKFTQRSIFKLFKKDEWEIICYLNRIEKRFIKPGMVLMIPMDLILAKRGGNILAENWRFAKKLVYEYPFFPRIIPREKNTPKLILISIKEQFLAVYEYGKLLFSCPISSAKPGHYTVRGRFKIFYKSPFHISTLYGDPMPWTMSFTKYYAIHEGEMPGHPASHGCVRLFKKDAKRLYNWAEIGTIVLIVDSFKKQEST